MADIIGNGNSEDHYGDMQPTADDHPGAATVGLGPGPGAGIGGGMYDGGDNISSGDEQYQREQFYSGEQQQQQQQQHRVGTSNTGPGSVDDTTNIPSILLLNHFCAHAFPPQDDSEEARAAADNSWEPVRDWMRSHSAEDVLAAAEQRDDAGKTALHFACQNNPPKDIIDVFLSIAAETVQWPDSFGWLPIHYACAYGADTQVIKSLAEAFPESKTTVDRKGRTPLHFALGTSSSNSPDIVALLSSTGAAGYPDDNGMLPLHYAAAYGAPEEALYVLTSEYHEGITTMDKRGRTPLHFALSNAGRRAAPAAVRLLLSLNHDLVNSNPGGGPLPLRVLADYASTVKYDEDSRESIESCLKYLLAAKPNPTADFFTAMQSLPVYLQERAVVMRIVQELLNDKIAQRFPTAILLLDLYVQIMVVFVYTFAVQQSVTSRFDGGDGIVPSNTLIWVWLGGCYFLAREVFQVISLISLKALHIWAYEPSNWLNVIYVILLFTWSGYMSTGGADANAFRTGAAISFGFIWIKFLAYLRNILIAFAVFTGGVFNVMRRLVAFLICLMIILVAFSRMWFTLFYQTEYCDLAPSYDYDPPMGESTQNPYDPVFVKELKCEANPVRVWCDGWDSFLAVYAMLLGEVDETVFNSNTVAIVLFVIFMLLVVILLANVLIAIVTDSYKIIQDQRAAIVFWTNRLDFIAQMDAIANGPWRTRLRRVFGLSEVDRSSANVTVTFGKDLWDRLMGLFEGDLDEHILSLEFVCYTLMRLMAIVIIPCWLFVGALVAGWLWPPQVRKQLFTRVVSKHSSETEKEEELRKTQVQLLKAEIKILKDDLLQELAIDRTQVVQMKSSVAERKLEIQNEMKHIKRIVTMLFEQSQG